MVKARVLKEAFDNEVEQVVQTEKAPKCKLTTWVVNDCLAKKQIIARVKFNKLADESVSSFTS